MRNATTFELQVLHPNQRLSVQPQAVEARHPDRWLVVFWHLLGSVPDAPIFPLVLSRRRG
jgi:hypothetical protein